MHVLAGDIGGTKTAVAILEIDRERVSLSREHRYPSAEFDGLEQILDDFLAGGRHPACAGFGVAGPVRDGRARVTKLPWILDERRLSRGLSGAAVVLVNDFVAAALGIPYLKPRQTRSLAKGHPDRRGPLALIGAGTGLGQAGLLPIDGLYEPFPSEGGHADFGPRDPLEDRLAAFVRERFGRATWDRLLSGEGLGHIYDFFKAEGLARESPVVAAELERGDRAAVISRFGLEGKDPLCRETLGRFVSLYGSEAGNAALRYRASGGVYVGGGIAPKILPALETGEFVRAFCSKPPMEEFLAKIPIRVVLEPRLGLYGAGAAAYRMAIETTRPSSKTTVRRTRR